MSHHDDDIVRELEEILGGTLSNLRRLSGGASRVTSSFDLDVSGAAPRALILQQYRGSLANAANPARVETNLLAAAHASGVPVPEVVATLDATESRSGAVVVARLDGETIPRKLLRDDEWRVARERLTTQCAHALAAIHRIAPDSIEGLTPRDPFERPLGILDGLGVRRPALELALRWLELHRVARHDDVLVHGDFRLGNLMINHDGLSGVLDWELAHRGDPAEDLGWLCAPPWRFGGPGAVGGFGSLDELLAQYESAGGVRVTRECLQWWQVYATLKWAIICALQASAHLTKVTRSIELAAIGRRVCENEWDLFGLFGTPAPFIAPVASTSRIAAEDLFGRPSALELLEATHEYLDEKVMRTATGAARFEALVARNVVDIARRELEIGPELLIAHNERLGRLGFSSTAQLCDALRAGTLDSQLDAVAVELYGAARDQLLVANPGYLHDGAVENALN